MSEMFDTVTAVLARDSKAWPFDEARKLIKRLEKLPVNPTQDRLHTIALSELETRYQALCNSMKSNEKENEDLAEIYWMLEELRVSFFAQQLGTAYPVSAKRVKLKLAELKG